MSLTLQLDDANASFEKLVETARALIPGRAPLWTDHNVHDPGITLLELMAWNTEAQIYSLGRSRRDERIAYAALLGVSPRGPLPASGLIWPSTAIASGTTPIPWAKGTQLTTAESARSDRESAPEFALATSILLIDAPLTKLAVIDAEGRVSGVTISNRQDGAGYRPFGSDGTSVLKLTFKGSLATSRAQDAKARVVSLGVDVEGSPPSIGLLQASRAAPAAVFDATLEHAGRRLPLRIVTDTTHGLLRTGVVLLDIGNIDALVDEGFTIELAPRATGLLRVPFVTRIEPNVLPIVEVRAVDRALTQSSTGFPDQHYPLPEAGLMFGAGAPPPQVTVDDGLSSSEWLEAADLAECGPEERKFAIDRARETVHFGNGVNGAIPPAGARIAIKYDVCAGAGGNLPRRLRWRIAGIAGIFGENPVALSGGSNGATLEDLQREARRKLSHERPIVTSGDLQQAARDLDDLKVARAEEIRDICTGPTGLRTLVVLAERRAGEGISLAENAAWLAAVRGRLKGRMPLGQQLRVVAPDYVRIGIVATLIARPQANPADVRKAAADELARRFALVSKRAGETPWPFERDVTVREIQGWLRRVQGVARVVSASMKKNGAAVSDGVAKIQRTELPRLDLDDEADITVLRPGESSP